MRILSQDGIGTVDLPYEQVGVNIHAQNKNEIIAYPIISLHEDDYWTMARYSTESKAKKAMEMLREKYLETSQWCSEVAYGEIDYPKIFQFPSDSEIEV